MAVLLTPSTRERISIWRAKGASWLYRRRNRSSNLCGTRREVDTQGTPRIWNKPHDGCFSRGIVLYGVGLSSSKRPGVQLSQPEFLVLICLGSIISSSSIIPLSMQAESFEDETAAYRACTALPWLYTTGWMLQYSCISVKSYRMYALTEAHKRLKRVELRIGRMFAFVCLLLLANWLIILPWTILDPLTWQRSEIGTDLDRENSILTYASLGRCTSENLFYWVGPLLGLQLVTMIVTSCILWRIRNVSDRYQESKHFIMASVYIFEMLVVGVPILVVVGDSAEASYIVLTYIVGLSDLGILLMIFVSKMLYRQQGLPEGVTVGESIFNHKRRTSAALKLMNYGKRPIMLPQVSI
jgi:hypothetical protein